MSIYLVRRVTQASLLSLLIAVTGGLHAARAQTPTATPPTSPAQRDATRPPGTERNQPVPEQARPTTQDPTAPPGTTRPDPQAPPGTSVAPTTSVPQTDTLAQPNVTTAPATAPATGDETTTTTGSGSGEPRDPAFPNITARPLPPLPNLMRLGVTSDNTLTLTLNDAIRRALENNNNIEVARNDVRFNETTLRALEGIFDPIFSFNPQLNNQVQSQQSTLGGGSTVTTTDLTGNTSVNKQFSTGGGNYNFFFNNNRRTTNNTFNALNPVYSASLGVTFTQPLLRDRSIDRNRRDIRIQRKRLEQSDADFRRQTIDVIAQVQRAYWDLVFALRDQQNLIANLNLSRELFRQTEARVAAGASAPLERAEVQTEIANRESALLQATQGVSIAENNLKQLIIRDPNAPEWTSQITPTDQPSFDSTPINLDDALTEARANRPELRRLRLQRDITNIDEKFFKNQTRPRIDIQATLATTGLSGSPVQQQGTGESVPIIVGDPAQNANAFLLDQINLLRVGQGLTPVDSPLVTVTEDSVPSNLIGGYGRTLRNLLGFGTRNIVVGVAIQLPFRNTTAEANLAGVRIQKTQLEASMRLQEQSVEVEVRNAAQAVETSRRRVLAARAARENAELQLQGEQRLYQVGRSTTFLLFQRENTLNNARNLELRAETDYNKALADLQRATSTTLRANNVIVETPTVP
ncbi:MAG TPA: TolC family protein [Pyrinomonadaceae bacterium]|jgi:HAE1 family hydrophobic/amphiphilic exporter-1|nr:TolC family protein [Pyrinomonadaceae bacterium]